MMIIKAIIEVRYFDDLFNNDNPYFEGMVTQNNYMEDLGSATIK